MVKSHNSMIIYTVIYGNKHPLHQPKCDISHDCYVITDQEIKKPGRWTVMNEQAHSSSSRRASRHSKMLPNLYFPNHSHSLYIDSQHALIVDPMYPSDQPLLAQFKHGPAKNPIKKTDLYDEAAVCIMLKKDYPRIIMSQIVEYAAAGHPRNFGIWSCGTIFRQHNHPKIIELGEVWWEEYQKHSQRDQISYPYCLWKLGIIPEPLEKRMICEKIKGKSIPAY